MRFGSLIAVNKHKLTFETTIGFFLKLDLRSNMGTRASFKLRYNVPA